MSTTGKKFSVFAIAVLILAITWAIVVTFWTAESGTSSVSAATAVVPIPPPTDLASEPAIEIDPEPVATIPQVEQDKADFGRIDPEGLKTWKKVMTKSGLSPLESRRLDEDDIEIRYWDLPDLYIAKTKCWVFSREAGRWNAYALVDVDFKGPIIKVPLDTHMSDWSKWETYAVHGLSPRRLRAPEPRTYPMGDDIKSIIEVKFGRDYARRYADDSLRTDLFRLIKSDFLNNDPERWATF